MIRFYKGERNGEKINLSDSPEYLQMFSKLWKNCDGTDEYYEYMVEIVLGLEELWKIDLNKIDGLKVLVSKYLINIEKMGIEEAIREIL